jgi:hypothetical protein
MWRYGKLPVLAASRADDSQNGDGGAPWGMAALFRKVCQVRTGFQGSR